jgi:hypothetical protein
MCPDAHQCLEGSKSSRMYLSGRHGNTSGRTSEFDKYSNFLHRHVYGKTTASIQMTGQHRLMRSFIRQDVEKNFNHPDVRATSSRRGPYYGNFVQQSCNCPETRATSSGRGLNMESMKRVMERWLHSCPSRRPQLDSWCDLEKNESVSI